MRALLTSAVLVAALAVPAAVVRAQQPGDAAARMGSRTFTLGELDAEWKDYDAKSKAEADQALYDGRKEALDRLVARQLVERAARAKNTTANAFMKDEIARRAKAVSDADVAAFFKANEAQMRGRPLEEMAPGIKVFLTNRQEDAARDAIIAELRKAGEPVRMTLEPPRVKVPVDAADPGRGPATAPITLVEFSDYQCPFCSRVTPTLKRLKETYGERLRIVWKDFPLTDIHPQARKAAEAAWCAGEQGKYWEYHDRLFANQSTLAVEGLKQHATAVGLEPVAFAACLDAGRHAGKVSAGIELGKDLGVDSTPTAFVNGRRLTGAQGYEVFVDVIEDELARLKP